MGPEHSIFISYRRVDGVDLASWLFQKLSGYILKINSRMTVLTVQMDLAVPSKRDWKKYINNELENANSLLVVCSQSTMFEYTDREDFFYHEISWWINNRKDFPPILVAIKEDGNKYVPNIITDCWSNQQVSLIDSLFLDEKSEKANRYREIFLESITLGISNPQQHSVTKVNLSKTNTLILDIGGVFAWEKDRFGRYIYVNELYAKAAGFDSPYSMLRKTDYDMPWKSLADFFIEGDQKIMTGNEQARIGVHEKEIMVDKVADIYVHEGVLKDHSGRIIGVRGCFIEMNASNQFFQNRNRFKMDKNGIYLGPEFGNQYLDNLEIKVFKGLVKNTPKEKIALSLNIDIKHTKSIIQSLIQKFQCTREEDILVIAVRAGLPIELFST